MPKRAEQFLPVGNDVLVILIALAGGPLHGYRIIQEVDAQTSGSVRLQTGALYRALKRLLDDDLIEECAAPKNEASPDERRRYYRLTAFGAKVLDAEVERLETLVHIARRAKSSQRPSYA